MSKIWTLVMPSPFDCLARHEKMIILTRYTKIHHVENFYAKATHLHDLDIDFDGGGFENIQALTLICVYMLLVSRENTAWAYHGKTLSIF